MLELTKKADYALRLMIEVASSDDAPVSTASIAEREDIPYQYLRKVAQQLVGAGLLTSSRGPRGGLRLAHPPQATSLLDIVRVADAPALSRCLVDVTACSRRNRCVIFPVWRRLQREVERAMESVLLSDLAEHHRAIFSSGRSPKRSIRRSRKRESASPIWRGGTARTPDEPRTIRLERIAVEGSLQK